MINIYDAENTHRIHYKGKENRHPFLYSYKDPFPSVEHFQAMVDAGHTFTILLNYGVRIWDFREGNILRDKKRFAIKADDKEALNLLGGKIICEYKGFALVEA